MSSSVVGCRKSGVAKDVNLKFYCGGLVKFAKWDLRQIPEEEFEQAAAHFVGMLQMPVSSEIQKRYLAWLVTSLVSLLNPFCLDFKN